MNADEIRAAVAESLKAMGVEMRAVYTGQRKLDDWECDAWRITLVRKPDTSAAVFNYSGDASRKSVEFDYHTGLGHRAVPKRIRLPYYIKDQRGIAQWKKENAKPVSPDVTGVLSCLILDASANDQSFNDWCGDLGYSTDSRKALDTYQACCDTAIKLYKLFSRAEVASLRELLSEY